MKEFGFISGRAVISKIRNVLEEFHGKESIDAQVKGFNYLNSKLKICVVSYDEYLSAPIGAKPNKYSVGNGKSKRYLYQTRYIDELLTEYKKEYKKEED